MSLRSSASTTDWVECTTSVPGRTAFTMMAWVYPVTTGAFQCFFANIHFGIGPGGLCVLNTDSAGTKLNIFNGSADTSGSGSISSGTWYHVAMVGSGDGAGGLTGYLNGVSDVSASGNSGLGTLNVLIVAGDDGFDTADCRVAAVKIYSAALTAAEIAQEMHTIRPFRTANLHSWLPCFPGSGENIRDYSGNGRTWTINGTITDEDPPPVSFGDAPYYVGVAAAAAAGQPAAARFQMFEHSPFRQLGRESMRVLFRTPQLSRAR